MVGSRKLVVVAMSGGVDSSVAAALLKNAGYEVIGIMLRLWNEVGKENTNRCCTIDSISMARRVCAKLDIPFYIIDAKDIFYQVVVRYFLESYTNGVTPNPCILCNQQIRWGFLLSKALSMGADYLATGHYARIISMELGGKMILLKGKDKTKDQSYVLYSLTQKELIRTLFPLGNLLKSEVRQIAHDFQLPVAERHDSQDLCFLGDENYRSFLKRYKGDEIIPGPIKDREGKQLGIHDGLAFYTIGQRKGLGLQSLIPLYVIEKDIIQNTLIVGKKEELGKKELIVTNVNWISGIAPIEPILVQVKIRYKSNEIQGYLTPLENEQVIIKFPSTIRDITPGQAAVFYQGEVCLGGGTIL